MRSASRTSLVLVVVGVVLGSLALGACSLAAFDDAQFRALEKQRCDIAAAACGVEVMQRSEVKAHTVHESQSARHGAVIA
jgi:hypothetical protein